MRTTAITRATSIAMPSSCCWASATSPGRFATGSTSELAGRNDLPLDLYTWRVSAFNGQHAELLDIPDFDLRFRKKVEFNGREVIGFFSSPTRR